MTYAALQKLKEKYGITRRNQYEIDADWKTESETEFIVN